MANIKKKNHYFLSSALFDIAIIIVVDKTLGIVVLLNTKLYFPSRPSSHLTGASVAGPGTKRGWCHPARIHALYQMCFWGKVRCSSGLWLEKLSMVSHVVDFFSIK